MLVVEPARGDDVGEVATLAHRSLTERFGPVWVQQHLDTRRSTFLVARDIPSDRVVGFAVAREDEGACGHLLALAVDGMYRGRGIGTALLRGVEDAVVRHGAFRIELDVRADDPRTQGFYARHGFEPAGLYSRVYADGADAVHMMRPVR